MYNFLVNLRKMVVAEAVNVYVIAEGFNCQCLDQITHDRGWAKDAIEKRQCTREQAKYQDDDELAAGQRIDYWFVFRRQFYFQFPQFFYCKKGQYRDNNKYCSERFW